MHAISACYTASYPFNKGKISALNILKAGEFTVLYEVLGEENATDAELMATDRRFFTAVYGQPEGTSTSLARTNLYTRKKGKPLRIMALPTGYLSEKVSFWLFKISESQKGCTFSFNDILRLYTIVFNIAMRSRA